MEITRGSHCIELQGEGRRARRRSKKHFGIMRPRENTNPFTGNHPFTQAFSFRRLVHSFLLLSLSGSLASLGYASSSNSR